MRRLLRLAVAVPMAGACGGCTSFMVQEQSKHWPSYYTDCPTLYQSTRLELASLSWAFSDDSKPADPCLARFYPKAGKDAFYHDVNQMMTPLYMLSLPVDVLLDTFTLPVAVSTASPDE